jgi:hypothetical protein
MAAVSWDEELQGLGNGFAVDGGIAIQNFEEYTFRAPRPGFFLGDSSAPSGDINPVVRFELENRSENIPPCPSVRPFLGKLDAMATELLCQVFVHLDMCSLLSFRRVNQYSKDMVDSFPPFRSIITFPKLLGAVEALQCRSWTIEALMHCVFDDRCSACGHFGDFMYLVTPERWCYKCWLQGKNLGVQRVPPSVMSQEEALRTCPHVPNVRLSVGYYGRMAKVPSSRPDLVFDLRSLQCALPAASSWPHANVRKGHPLRYTTVIRAPYWDAHTERFEEGFFCRACSSQGWSHRSRNGLTCYFFKEYPVWGLPWRRYTRDGMKAHIDRYGTIFKIQTTEEETRYVHEKPFAERTWEEPSELFAIPLLRRCREKEIKYPQGQPFLDWWEHVSSQHEVKEYSDEGKE